MRQLYSLVLIPLVACIEPPEIEVIERSCVDCPYNTSELAANPFNWVTRDKAPPVGEGVKLLWFGKGKRIYPLDVQRTVLRYWGDDQRWHDGQELNGGVMRVITSRGSQIDIKINQFGNGLPYWTDKDTGSIETYVMSWKMTNAPDSEFRDFCPPDTGQFAGAYHKEAVIFEGDHYDPQTFNITKTDTTDFAAPFNMSCVGTLPSKMALMRQTSVTSIPIPVWPPLADDQQALVRAFAAQYCGGQTYTQPGHGIRINDRNRDLSPAIWGLHPADFPETEAVWNSKGAVCLDTPRLEVWDLLVEADESVRSKIERECPDLEPCSGLAWFNNGDWKSHGQLKTVTIKSDMINSVSAPAP